jgi:hypothetical protein
VGSSGREARARLATGAAVLFAACLATTPPVLSQEILPFSEVKAGMSGVGRTVFSGTKIDEFKVEVMGTLENIAPRRNLILAKLSGGPLAETGVLSGMSGSPVYLNGRLAGAVAYTWGFARQPIAGIVPIQEMLGIEARDAAPSRTSSWFPAEAGPGGLHWLADPASLPGHFASYFQNALPEAAAGGPLPIGAPLLTRGVPQEVLDLLSPGLRHAGFLPVQGGSTGHGLPGTGDTSLEPGSGVGIALVRGDVEIAAICTVTHRDADRLYACGHPLLNLGPTELSMTTASVAGLFPSLESSFKFATVGDEVGVFRQDRTAGVFGYVGRKPRTIPVRLDLQPERGRPRRLAFDVADDPFLAPYLLYAAINAVLSSEEKDYGTQSFTYKDGSVLHIEGEDDIVLRNLFAGDQARLYASGTLAFLTQVLLDSEYRSVHVTGIDLVLGTSDERRTARLLRAWVGRERVKAGETVQVSVGIKPFRGPEVTRDLSLTLPAELPPGRLILQVGDALTLARSDSESSDDFVPRDLKQLIFLINRLRRNDRLYAVLTRADNGLVFQGARLPNLPPSMAEVMARPQARGNVQRVLYRGVAEESLALPYALEGYRLIAIDVEE